MRFRPVEGHRALGRKRKGQLILGGTHKARFRAEQIKARRETASGDGQEQEERTEKNGDGHSGYQDLRKQGLIKTEEEVSDVEPQR